MNKSGPNIADGVCQNNFTADNDITKYLYRMKVWMCRYFRLGKCNKFEYNQWVNYSHEKDTKILQVEIWNKGMFWRNRMKRSLKKRKKKNMRGSSE